MNQLPLNDVQFRTVTIGGRFYHNGQYFEKIDPGCGGCGGGVKLNAVCFDTESVVSFNQNQIVQIEEENAEQ